VFDDKERFAVILRWKIYEKIGNKIYTSSDVEKYEELVQKFVSKFKSTELSNWEAATWLNKVIKTKSDVHEAIFNSEVSESASEVSSQELSLLSDQEFDSKENGETKREDDSVSAIFDKAKAYEDLCSKLPDVPEIEDPDEVIEQRLRKLKARDETRDTKAGFEKSEDVKNEIHMKVKNNIE
jgi:hypothetical protein